MLQAKHRCLPSRCSWNLKSELEVTNALLERLSFHQLGYKNKQTNGFSLAVFAC